MQTSGPAIILQRDDTSVPSFTAPNVSSDATLKFSLTVKDDKGIASKNPAIVTVTVKPAIQKSAISTTASNTAVTQSNQSKFSTSNEYVFVRKWGSSGTGDGQFSYPSGIAVDSSGNVYVVDGGFGIPRIQKFDSNGKFITKWGSEGTGDGQFQKPSGIAVDSSGNVYVVEYGNNRIQKFDSNGKFITKWGSSGTGDGQFSYPSGIAVDSSGNVYVVEYGNNRIQKFDSNGKFITKWGSQGTRDGQFDIPQGIAVDSSGNVYVAQSGTNSTNSRVQKFGSNGEFITKWGSSGTGDGHFRYPEDIKVDSSGNVYVMDMGNNRIQKFDSNGKFITKWGSSGTGDGQFSYPSGIAVDSSGNVYITDSGNSRIQVFAPSHNPSR